MKDPLYDISAKVAEYAKSLESLKKVIFDLDLPRYKYILEASNYNHQCEFVLSTKEFIETNDDFTKIILLLVQEQIKINNLVEDIRKCQKSFPQKETNI